MSDNVNDCKKSFYSAVGGPISKTLYSPSTLSKIYWTVSIPRLLKCSEVRYFHPKELTLYEKHHRMMAKHIQRLPETTPNASCLSSLGWQPVLTHIEKMKLLFLGRMIRRPPNCLYKRVFLFRFFLVIASNVFSCESPAAQIVDICMKYNILQNVINIVLSGNVPSKDQWGSIIKPTINRAYSERWRLDLTMYSHLSIYKQVFPTVSLCCWLQMCKIYPRMTKIFTTILRLINCNSNLAAYCGKLDKTCHMCAANVVEDLKHFIMYCPAYDELRKEMKTKIMSSISYDAQISLMDFTEDECFYLLLGMNSPIDEDDIVIIRKISALYIFKMYKSRPL